MGDWRENKAIAIVLGAIAVICLVFIVLRISQGTKKIKKIPDYQVIPAGPEDIERRAQVK